MEIKLLPEEPTKGMLITHRFNEAKVTHGPYEMTFKVINNTPPYRLKKAAESAMQMAILELGDDPKNYD